MQLPVLLYHYVGPSLAGLGPALTVSTACFEKQVHWLARRGYSGICASDWLHGCRGEIVLPRKPVLLTFDDAYADVADYALPILRRYDFRATIFVVTSQLGGTNAWDEWRRFSRRRLMTANEIRHWAAEGIEFGAHSRTHADLTALTGSELEDEVSGSAHDLTSVLGSRAISFAYPYGSYNQKVRNCVRGVFDLAFSTDKGLNDFHTEPDILRRIGVRNTDSRMDIECCARWGWRPIERLRARIAVAARGIR